jgi:hypothetical protein
MQAGLNTLESPVGAGWMPEDQIAQRTVYRSTDVGARLKRR